MTPASTHLSSATSIERLFSMASGPPESPSHASPCAPLKWPAQNMLSVTMYLLLAILHVLWSTTFTSALRILLRNLACPGSLRFLSPQPVKQFHANRSLKLWTTFWNKYKRGKLHSTLDYVVLKKQNQALIKVHNLFKMASDEVLFSLIWSYLAMGFLKMLGCCVKLYWRWRVPDNIAFGPGDTSYGGLNERLCPKGVPFSGLTYLKG